MEIGARIEQARRAKRISQAELGKRIGVYQSRVSELERGQGEPTASQIVAISLATGASVEYLVTGQEPTPAMLPEDEAYVLEVYRATGLTRRQAVDALIREAKASAQETPPAPARPLGRPIDQTDRILGRDSRGEPVTQ